MWSTGYVATFCCNRIASHNENSGGSMGDQAHALCTRHTSDASAFTSCHMLNKAWKLETPRVENLTQNILQFIFCATFPSHSYCCTSELKTAVEQLECSWQKEWESNTCPWIQDLGQMVSLTETEPIPRPALPVL